MKVYVGMTAALTACGLLLLRLQCSTKITSDSIFYFINGFIFHHLQGLVIISNTSYYIRTTSVFTITNEYPKMLHSVPQDASAYKIIL